MCIDCEATVMIGNSPVCKIYVNDMPLYQVWDFMPGVPRPYFLMVRPDSLGLQAWIEDRITPKTRQGLSNSLRELGVPFYSIPWLLCTSNGMSVNDDFWMKFRDFGEQTYEDLLESRLPCNIKATNAKIRKYMTEIVIPRSGVND